MLSFIPWIEVTIVGAVYLAFLLFLILKMLSVYNFDFLSNKVSYLPYIAVVLAFLAYAVGLAVHLVSSEIISCLAPQYKFEVSKQINFQQNASEQLRQTFGSAYGSLVMFRHLFVSFMLLAFAILLWLKKHTYAKNKWLAFAVCVFFSLLFLWAWRTEAGLFSQLRDKIY